MKKVEITDDTGKIIKVDIEKFKKHLDEFHLNGLSAMKKMDITLQLTKDLEKK